jgi:hypothetical protein
VYAPESKHSQCRMYILTQNTHMYVTAETADKLSKQGADLMKEARHKGTLFKQKLRGKGAVSTLINVTYTLQFILCAFCLF